MLTHLLRKFIPTTAALLDVSFLVQLLFVPLAFALSTRQAQAETIPVVEFTYDSQAHEFSLAIQPVESATYTVEYDTQETNARYGFTGTEQADTQGRVEVTQAAESVSGTDVITYTVPFGRVSIEAVLQGGEEYTYKSPFRIDNGQLVLMNAPTTPSGYWSQVALNTPYISPDNDLVSVTFTSLPELSGDLRIQEVALTPEQMEEIGAPTAVAYEITSSMTNGSFTYDLTLPNVTGNDDVEVQFSEDGKEFETANPDELTVGEQEGNSVVTLEGLDHFTVFVVTYNSVPNPLPASFSSLGYQATSTREFGDHLRLTGADRKLGTLDISLTNWSCESEYTFVDGNWVVNPSGPCVTTPGSSFRHPITVNLYNVDTSGTTPTVGTLITSQTQTLEIPFRPSADLTNCTGNMWYDSTSSSCKNGFAFVRSYDFSSSNITLPDEVIVTIAFNTQSHGFNPLGQPGPYNSLNVSLTTEAPYTGTDVEPDAMFWNTTHAGFYTDGGSGGTGTLRRDTAWTPYTLVTKFSMLAANTAPTVTIESPTPAANSYVKGIITGRAVANDDYGMGSYYLRFWQNAFEIAGGGTLQGYCQSAPGGNLLGTSQDVTCSYDTTQHADGTYVFSAQFLDADNKWGQALRSFIVDNTKPVVTIKTETGMNNGSLGSNGIYSRISFKLNDPNGGLTSAVLNGHVYTRTNQWNDLNWQNINKSHLVQGVNTIYAVDRAGNQSEPLTFIYDTTGPTITVKPAPNSLGSGSLFRKVSFSLFDANKVDRLTMNGVEKDLTDNNSSDLNDVGINNWFGEVEGLNTLVVFDVAGNSTTYTFTLDRTIPTAPEIEFPVPEQNFTTTPILNNWTEVTDASGISHYRIEYQYDDHHTFSDAPYREATISQRYHSPAANEQDGVNIRVQAFDNAGNEGTWSDWRHYYYDSTLPETPIISGFINPNLVCGAVTNSSNITVDWNDILDDQSGFKEYQYLIDYPLPAGVRGQWQTTLTSSQYSGGLNEGLHTIKVRAKDNAGNYSSWSNECDITLDSDAPDAPTSGLPHNISQNTNDFSFTWSDESDSGSPVTYEFQSSMNSAESGGVLTENVWKSIDYQGNPQFYPLNTPTIHSTGASDGTWYWQVRTVDQAGNVSPWSQIWNVTLDTAAPDVLITAPTAGQTLTDVGLFNITGTITDNLKLLRYYFTIVDENGDDAITPLQVNTSATNESLSYFWETSSLADGEYTLKLEALDAANNEDTGSVHTIKVNIVNTPEPSVEEEEEVEEEQLKVTTTSQSQVLGVTTSNSNSSSGTGGTTGAPVCGATSPNAISSLNIATTASGATLSWTKPAGSLTHYALEFVRLDANGNETGRYGVDKFGDANTTSFTIDNLPGGSSYRFELFAVNDCAPGARAIASSALITAPGAAAIGLDEVTLTPNTGEAQVLGAATDEKILEEVESPDENTTPEQGLSLMGQVLGASTENCSVPSWWWILLPAFLAILGLLHVLLRGRNLVIASLVLLGATSYGLYETLCGPWVWVGAISILTIVSIFLRLRRK